MTRDSARQGRPDLRLETLVGLRWIAVAGQAAAVLWVYFALDFDLPLGPCLTLVALSAALNIYLRFAFPARTRLAPRNSALLLAYDVVQLVGLLYLTGGLANPFAFLLLVPVVVSASALPVRLTVGLATLAIVAATGIVLYHKPLPWYGGATLDLPLLYVAGLYAAFVAALLFMSGYVGRIAEETRQMSEALETARIVQEREQRLSALDGLAAAAAHELGTPLGTISVVVKEMLRNVADSDPQLDDLKLLKSQVDRCRDILGELSSRSDVQDAHFVRMRLTELIEEVIEPHREFGVAIRTEAGPEPGGEQTAEPVGRRNPAVLHGLGNLIENATDFARNQVLVTAQWSPGEVRIVVADDGPGFAPDVIDRLGEPYVTTRGRKRKAAEEDEFGLGLGFFIAKTLLERSGASISLANRRRPQTGAVVTVTWPRRYMELGGDSDLPTI